MARSGGVFQEDFLSRQRTQCFVKLHYAVEIEGSSCARAWLLGDDLHEDLGESAGGAPGVSGRSGEWRPTAVQRRQSPTPPVHEEPPQTRRKHTVQEAGLGVYDKRILEAWIHLQMTLPNNEFRKNI